jgi:hypothetical protein
MCFSLVSPSQLTTQPQLRPERGEEDREGERGGEKMTACTSSERFTGKENKNQEKGKESARTMTTCARNISLSQVKSSLILKCRCVVVCL